MTSFVIADTLLVVVVGVVKYLNTNLLQIYYGVHQLKKYENRSIFGEVVGTSLVSCFFDSHCSNIGLIGNVHDIEKLQLAWFRLQSSPNKPQSVMEAWPQSTAPAVEKSNFKSIFKIVVITSFKYHKSSYMYKYFNYFLTVVITTF